jgi:hypothetical protein
MKRGVRHRNIAKTNSGEINTVARDCRIIRAVKKIDEYHVIKRNRETVIKK